jgi:hypothetical protein
MLSHHLDLEDDRLVVSGRVARLRAAAAPGGAPTLRRRAGRLLVALGVRLAGEAAPVRVAPR